MYVAKCYNRPYMKKPLGEKIPLWEKILIGVSLMVFILCLIALPMLLFSSINPVGLNNPVSKGEMRFFFNVDEKTLGTHMSV